MRNLVVRALLVLSLVSPVLGQLKTGVPSGPQLFSAPAQGTSLFSADRFSISHGFSMSMLTGGGAAPMSLAAYHAQVSYILSEKVDMKGNFQLVQPGGATPFGQPLPMQLFYNTSIDFRPANNLVISLGLSNLPTYGNSPYFPYGRYNNAPKIIH